jgi:MOSC domain-containing protein YiiM
MSAIVTNAPVGRVERIWLKRMKGGPMDECQRVRLVAGHGLEGNANQGGKRQVTILSQETWQRIAGEPSGQVLDPARRRANVLVSGVDLAGSTGRILSLGGLRIRIHGETRPCGQMDAAATGLQARMAEPWGGGVYGEVLDDGEFGVGDAAMLADR